MDAVLPKSGTYVVAVSGGVDSMALLHMLHAEPRTTNDERRSLKLVVAHVDHGIRTDSGEDRQLVEKAAQKYGLPFEYYEAHLGPNTSEAKARGVRYGFLREVQQARQAQAIITAHHQDDVLETAIINLLRGSGRKGLTALSSRDNLVRPLLAVPKRELLAYARQQHVQWREDSTNQDVKYLRNYVRQQLLPRFGQADRDKLQRIILDQRGINQELDTLLVKQLNNTSDNSLDRQWFIQLPHSTALEILASWLRGQNIRNFDSKTLERLVVAGKTGRSGQQFDVLHGSRLRIYKGYLALEYTER